MLQVLTEMLTIRTSYWTRKIQNFKERKDWNNFLIESFKIVSSLYEMIHHVVHVTQVQAQVHVVSTFPSTTCSHKNPPRNRHAQTDNHMDARMHLLSHSHNTWKTCRQAKRLTARQTNRFLKKRFPPNERSLTSWTGGFCACQSSIAQTDPLFWPLAKRSFLAGILHPVQPYHWSRVFIPNNFNNNNNYNQEHFFLNNHMKGRLLPLNSHMINTSRAYSHVRSCAFLSNKKKKKRTEERTMRKKRVSCKSITTAFSL